MTCKISLGARSFDYLAPSNVKDSNRSVGFTMSLFQMDLREEAGRGRVFCIEGVREWFLLSVSYIAVALPSSNYHPFPLGGRFPFSLDLRCLVRFETI